VIFEKRYSASTRYIGEAASPTSSLLVAGLFFIQAMILEK